MNKSLQDERYLTLLRIVFNNQLKSMLMYMFVYKYIYLENNLSTYLIQGEGFDDMGSDFDDMGPGLYGIQIFHFLPCWFLSTTSIK
jgi:hypothetical protein